LDENVENFTLGVHGTPEIDQVAIDLEMTSSRCEIM